MDQSDYRGSGNDNIAFLSPGSMKGDPDLSPMSA